MTTKMTEVSLSKSEISKYESSKLWIYLLRYSKLGPSLLWIRQKDYKLEEQCRALCDKVVRHLMSKVYIDHSPIKSPNFPEKPSEEVILYISSMTEYLFVQYPQLYSNVVLKLNVNLKDERHVCRAFSEFAEQLFNRTISWSLIASLLTFAGGLAIDCSKNGRSILVRQICDWATVFICLRLKTWLIEHGGWEGVLEMSCQDKSMTSDTIFFCEKGESWKPIKYAIKKWKKSTNTAASTIYVAGLASLLWLYTIILSMMTSSQSECESSALEKL